ncbi:hypothetical protein [Devosia sp. CAU 1758]
MSHLPVSTSFLGSVLTGPPTLYAVCYDLRIHGQDYPGLIDELIRNNGIRIQQSLWWVPSFHSAVSLRDRLAAYMDGNDSLMVAEIGSVAGYESRPEVRAWIERYLQMRVAA